MKTLERLRRSNKLISEINVVGFLSVMVVLLYIFMAPSIYVIDGRTHDANLPYANHPVPMPGANREDAIIIVVSRDGMIYLNNEKTELAELPASIHALVKSGSPKVAYFRADARARYRFVRDALEAVQAVGIEKVAFLVWDREDKGKL
jgi:biopolymer transport protein ExbD